VLHHVFDGNVSHSLLLCITDKEDAAEK